MKIKQIIISGLLLSGLAVLIAGILPDYRRTLNGVERAVFGEPETKKALLKITCYIETRMADRKTPATSESDAYFPEFIEGGLFDQLYEESVFTLVQELVANFNNLTRPQALIYLWFMRKNFDDKCDFSDKPGTAYNMSYFYLAHKVLFKTIKKAEKWAETSENPFSLGDLVAGCEDYARTAFTCVNDPDCLDYPTCFACSM